MSRDLYVPSELRGRDSRRSYKGDAGLLSPVATFFGFRSGFSRDRGIVPYRGILSRLKPLLQMQVGSPQGDQNR